MSGAEEMQPNMLTTAVGFGSTTSNGGGDAAGDGLHAKLGDELAVQNGRI